MNSIIPRTLYKNFAGYLCVCSLVVHNSTLLLESIILYTLFKTFSSKSVLSYTYETEISTQLIFQHCMAYSHHITTDPSPSIRKHKPDAEKPFINSLNKIKGNYSIALFDFCLRECRRISNVVLSFCLVFITPTINKTLRFT